VAKAQATLTDAQAAAAAQQDASARSQVRTQEAQAAARQAALASARLGLAEATIAAPFHGIVVSRSLDPGAYVTPGTSTPIVQIVDLDRIDVLVNVTEAVLPALRVGAPAAIQVDAYPGRTFSARVSRIAGGIDPTSRTVQVEIDLPNPGRLLRPGMYATVALSAGAGTPVLIVPLTALGTAGDRHFVWVVTGGAAHERQVTVGQALGDAVEIASGLTEGDLVVTKGIALLREGQRVQTAADGV
jgi:RND family efflux transporter MFP subunit